MRVSLFILFMLFAVVSSRRDKATRGRKSKITDVSEEPHATPHSSSVSLRPTTTYEKTTTTRAPTSTTTITQTKQHSTSRSRTSHSSSTTSPKSSTRPKRSSTSAAHRTSTPHVVRSSRQSRHSTAPGDSTTWPVSSTRRPRTSTCDTCAVETDGSWQIVAIVFIVLVVALVMISIVFLVLILKGRRRPKPPVHLIMAPSSITEEATPSKPKSEGGQRSQTPSPDKPKEPVQTVYDNLQEATAAAGIQTEHVTQQGSAVGAASFVPTNQLV